MYLALGGILLVERNIGEMWLQGSYQIGVETRHQVVVVLFLGRVRKYGPWEVVNIPGVSEIDIGES